jgi:hypothetical protein
VLTWGLFGLLSGGGIEGAVLWAVIGAACGGLYAYWTEHLLTKSELARVGAHVPADSSALLAFCETSDVTGLLAVGRQQQEAVVTSVAAIEDDLSTHTLTSAARLIESSQEPADVVAAPERRTLLSMILVRYPRPEAAQQIATEFSKGGGSAQIELVMSADQGGGRHVSDPTHGVAPMARSDVLGWGAFGLVFGAISGGLSGGGVVGLVGNAVLTGVAWGLFGLVAGVLYGLWAGQAVSARRLRRLGQLLTPGSSMLLAWADGPASPGALDALTDPGAKSAVLRFQAIPGGVVLDAPEDTSFAN